MTKNRSTLGLWLQALRAMVLRPHIPGSGSIFCSVCFATASSMASWITTTSAIFFSPAWFFLSQPLPSNLTPWLPGQVPGQPCTSAAYFMKKYVFLLFSIFITFFFFPQISFWIGDWQRTFKTFGKDNETEEFERKRAKQIIRDVFLLLKTLVKMRLGGTAKLVFLIKPAVLDNNRSTFQFRTFDWIDSHNLGDQTLGVKQNHLTASLPNSQFPGWILSH